MKFVISQKLFGLLRVGAGIIAICALFFFSKIDLEAFTVLANGRAAIICVTLVFLSLPLAALRWALLLRMLSFDIPLSKLYHVIAISNFLNAFLVGPLGGDLTRAIYIWRIVGHSSASIASSIVVDRLLGLFSAFCVVLLYVIFNWSWMKDVPALLTLGISVFLGFFGIVVGVATILIVPVFIQRIQRHVLRWPRISSVLAWADDTVGLICRSPVALLSALALALLAQAMTVVAVMVVGHALGAEALSLVDYMLAVPVTLVANTLPITPNGLGIGEAAFDQVCRWLVTSERDFAYSNIFFGFRILGLVASLSGLVSLFMYRNSVGDDPVEPVEFKTRDS